MDKAQREDLARRVLAFSNSAQTEVLVQDARFDLTRFTHNAIHQNVSSDDVSVSVRAILPGGRIGVARTNVHDQESLRDVVRRAADLAAFAPEDPLVPRLPGGSAIDAAPEDAFVKATAQTGPEDRARMCASIFQSAEPDDLWAAGYVTTSHAGVAIANTSGTFLSFEGTDAGVNVKMNAANSTGFGEAYDTDVRRIDAGKVGSVSAAKARNSAQPAVVDPGAWTVILEPAAFGELFSYVADHFSAQAFDEGSSFLTGAMGATVLGENVTISDDYAHKLNPGMPFDWEGQPTQRIPLVEHGIAKNIVTDSYWANKLKRENTGHALPAPNADGPQASHLVVSPGTKTTSELIAETKRGLLISRFWYIRTVDQKHAIVTGMTRDGTFLIEDGHITRGVRNMRFNQSIIESLKQCVFSNELRRTGGYSYSLVVPTAKIENFTFSSGTDF
ncbi:MAG: TldD/PmbA family protein [Candidatus Eremiobacteraeota bacterium]|nr:TldD/PmbA family protein [Candidatus Eremiobacteraeota bacterium]